MHFCSYSALIFLYQISVLFAKRNIKLGMIIILCNECGQYQDCGDEWYHL